jgi:uncharacterized RDD family membrane protein YckC
VDNPYAPPTAQVYDVEPAALPFEQAERQTRLGAAVIDTLIGGLVTYVPLFFAGGFSENPDAVNPVSALIWVAVMFVGVIVWGVVSYIFVRANGQSIGKKILGIKVVRSDGSRASVARIFWLRNVVNGLLNIIPIYGIVDVLFIFRSSERCLHDNLADTVVIKA